MVTGRSSEDTTQKEVNKMEPVEFDYKLVDRDNAVVAQSDDKDALVSNYSAEELERYRLRVVAN
jgi:hypothetical protein